MKPYEKKQEQIKQLEQKITEESGTKYDCGGIYSISIDNKLVYIGKSNNIKNRLANHMLCIIDKDPGNKYRVMRTAIDKGHQITFDKVQRCDVQERIAWLEAYWIRHYMPPLNYQIPKLDDPSKFEINKHARTITLEEILYPDECFQF